MSEYESYITDRTVVIKHVDDPDEPSYLIRAPQDGGDIARVEWLSLQPSGTPLAFGDGQTVLSLGGNSKKRIEWSSGGPHDGNVLYAAGARIYLGDDA